MYVPQLEQRLGQSSVELVGPYNRETDWVFASPTMKGNQPLWPETLWRRYGRPAVKAIQKRVGSTPSGAGGAVAIQGGRRFSARAVPVEVVDPVGAGDSFDAGFLHQFLSGADLADRLTYGNLCGSLSTTDCGGTEAFRDPVRMKEFLRRPRQIGSSVAD